jgi:hypothetical protein
VESDEAGRSCHEKAHSLSFRGSLRAAHQLALRRTRPKADPGRVDPITP